MSEYKKLSLSEAVKKQNAKKKEIALIQKLISGELEAEGRLIDADMTEEEGVIAPFKKIQRQMWISYEPDFELSSLNGSPFIEIGGGAHLQEAYVNILVLFPIIEPKNKGGRPSVLDKEILYAQIATYYVITAARKQVEPEKSSLVFRKEMMEKIPCLYDFVNSDDTENKTRTVYRRLDGFCELYQKAVKEFDKMSGE